MKQVTNISKCVKGNFYIFHIEKLNLYYTVMQHGQRTWVANAINLQVDGMQYFTGNSYDIVSTVAKEVGDITAYVAYSIPEFRKGVMAVLVGQKPDCIVVAKNVEGKIIIEVEK